MLKIRHQFLVSLNKFCDENREWAYLRPYLEDRPEQPWTMFSITNAKFKTDAKMKSNTKSNTKSNRKTNTKTNTRKLKH